MPVNEALFSSATGVWETPQAFFNKLNEEFNFEVDVCALPENAKCAMYYTPEIDGLAQDWKGKRCWMNPPYGRQVAQWIKKAYDSTREPGTTVVALLPSRTDTNYFHQYIYDKAIWASRSRVSIRFLKGRLKFGGASSGAPFPSMVVVFGD